MLNLIPPPLTQNEQKRIKKCYVWTRKTSLEKNAEIRKGKTRQNDAGKTTFQENPD